MPKKKAAAAPAQKKKVKTATVKLSAVAPLRPSPQKGKVCAIQTMQKKILKRGLAQLADPSPPPAKPPAHPVPRKGKARTVLPKFDPLAPVLSVPADPSPSPVIAPAQTGSTASHETMLVATDGAFPETLPIFLRWTVVDRIKKETVSAMTSHYANLCFDGKVVFDLEGPDAAKKLQHQADQWNAQEYIPKLEVHPGYFKQRPTREAFLKQPTLASNESRFTGAKPFVT